MESNEITLAQQYDLYGCYQCGKCTGGCPVSLRSKLNIRRLMIEGVLGRVLDRIEERQEIWDCTTCKTCTLRCPRGLRPMDLVIGLRGVLVEEGRIPKPLIEAMENAYKHRNPWGKARSKRSEWLRDLPEGLRVKDFSRGERAEFLYFVGCTVSSDPRVQEIARSMVYLLDRAGLDFGILGSEEQCCGNEIRRMGEVGLFEELRDGNLEAFEAYGVERLFTTCPHGLNTFRNEYPQGRLEVLHSSEILLRALERGEIRFNRELRKVVTYHDPCFLGKQNGLFDPPRQLICSIPGIELREMDRSRERSLCCEGGGGKMWVEASSEEGQRLAEIRVQDAVVLGAEVLVTACPLCVLTLEDAVKTSGYEDRIRVMDLVELLAEVVG